MKLARPDIRHPRIVLAGCPAAVQGDGDDAGLAAALRRRGLHARWMSWDDPDTVHTDLVILRATADYRDRLDEFLAWTRRVRNLLNPPDLVAWNADPRYLGDLERAGVPTLPDGSANPTALLFVGDRQSHALAANRSVEPDFELWDLGHAAIQAAADHVGISRAELLYARVDVTGDARLVGLDLIAPSLGWRRLEPDIREAAQREFALAVESALERLGLGPFPQPFPHRGP